MAKADAVQAAGINGHGSGATLVEPGPTIEAAAPGPPPAADAATGACADEQQTGTIGVALSGGGVRAALFSLGVMMYLVRSGLNKRVRMVTSVSGGSITNMAIAAAGDFSQQSSETFEPVCGRLASALAKRGSFFIARPRSVFLSIAAYALAYALGFIAVLWFGGERDMGWLAVFGLALVLGSVGGSALAMGVAFAFRQRLQRRAFRGLFGAAIGRKPGRFPSLRLDQLPHSEVTHVVCATELLSGQPMLFSQGWVYSPTFGWGEPAVGVDHAVYASAAFPGAFSPLRLRTSDLKMGGGWSNRDRPPTLRLADGGVYNNLGNDWFTITERAEKTPWGGDHRFTLPPKIGFEIIVNASSPSRLTSVSRVPVLRWFLLFARTMTVLYENTLRPRVAQLAKEPPGRSTVIDICMSPIALAERAKAGAKGDREVRRRANELIARLGGLSHEYWDELVEDTSLLKTTLWPAGTERSARLMRHGYLSAMVAFHSRFGTPGIDDVPDERYFVELTEAS